MPLDGGRGIVVGSFPVLLLPQFIPLCPFSPTLLRYTLLVLDKLFLPILCRLRTCEIYSRISDMYPAGQILVQL